ncbi:hypothetical protein, partial [Salmonella enterica]
KYLSRFDNNVDAFNSLLGELRTESQALGLDTQIIGQVSTAMQGYAQGFRDLGAGYQRLGLEAGQGLRGDMQQASEKLVAATQND